MFGSRRIRFNQAPPGGEILPALTVLVDDRQSPVIEHTYAMDEIARAHRAFEAAGGFSKRVVRTF